MSAATGGTGGEHRPTFGKERLAEETRERFVREVTTRVPLSRLVELHLFAPMRQGGMESGVAVLAATLDLPPETPSETPAEAPAEAPVDPVPDGDPTEEAAGPAPDEPAAEPEPVAEIPEPASVEEILEAVPEQSPPPATASATRRRHTVFTARYRLVLKGPERGKWEVEVREEADAPLITVEAVVRGVQQRSGDTGDPERLDAAGVARMLGVKLPEPGGAPPAP